jgi:hypothetical protein
MTKTGKLIKQVDALRAKHPHPIDKSRDYTAEINALIAWLKAGRPEQREPEQAQELEEEQKEKLEEEFDSAVSPPMHIPEIERPSVDLLELLIPESPLPEDSQYVKVCEDSPVTYEVSTPRSPDYNNLRTSSGRFHHAREDQREWVVDDSAIQMNMSSFEGDVESADDQSNDDEVREDLFFFVAGLVFLLVLCEYFFFLFSVLERLARG